MFSPFFHHLHWDVGEASASTDGAFSDTVADAMTHAGTVAAQGAGIDAAQAGDGIFGTPFFSVGEGFMYLQLDIWQLN